MRVHRDPFEPIMCVLEAESPLAEYRKVTDEIVRRMPDESRYLRPAAEAVRSFLLLHLGLHLGPRQKNLRQLRVCPRGHYPTSERRLEDMKCGELRWSDRDHGREVLILSVAFKNSGSSFFAQKPCKLILADLLSLQIPRRLHRPPSWCSARRSQRSRNPFRQDGQDHQP